MRVFCSYGPPLLFSVPPPPLCSPVGVPPGSARRMEGVDKILAPLGELPVLVHTLMALQDSPCVKEIVVVTREDLQCWIIIPR